MQFKITWFTLKYIRPSLNCAIANTTSRSKSAPCKGEKEAVKHEGITISVGLIPVVIQCCMAAHSIKYIHPFSNHELIKYDCNLAQRLNNVCDHWALDWSNLIDVQSISTIVYAPNTVQQIDSFIQIGWLLLYSLGLRDRFTRCSDNGRDFIQIEFVLHNFHN